MATIHINHLDDEVVRCLERRAASNNRSLESEVRGILEREAQISKIWKPSASAPLSLSRGSRKRPQEGRWGNLDGL